MDRLAKPGPQPGSRPTPGGYGTIPQPAAKGAGIMGIIMPLYTTAIVVFFVYTIMKVMFKKPEEDVEDGKEPVIHDFHMSTQYRPYRPQQQRGNGSAPAPARTRPVVVRRPPESAQSAPPATCPEDAEIDQLRRRLEETERAMERIMQQMSCVSDQLNVAKISSNIKAIKQDLWGSMDSVASDSMASDRSLSMESLTQTEASLAELEEDVGKAAQAAHMKGGKDKKRCKTSVTNGKQVAPGGLTGQVAGLQRVQDIAGS